MSDFITNDTDRHILKYPPLPPTPYPLSLCGVIIIAIVLIRMNYTVMF